MLTTASPAYCELSPSALHDALSMDVHKGLGRCMYCDVLLDLRAWDDGRTAELEPVAFLIHEVPS